MCWTLVCLLVRWQQIEIVLTWEITVSQLCTVSTCLFKNISWEAKICKFLTIVLLQNPFLWDISDLWSNTVYPKDLNLKLRYPLSLHSMHRRVCWLQLSYLDISAAVLLHFVTDTHQSAVLSHTKDFRGNFFNLIPVFFSSVIFLHACLLK